MDRTTQELKHRTKDQAQSENLVNPKPEQRKPRPSIPKRGIRSLAIGVAIPVALTLANISLFGFNNYRTIQKPFYMPPLWALHLTCLTSAFVMGLSAWLVWAEGGFHQKPAAIGAYLSQLGLSLVWNPVFFKMGAVRVGLLVCLGQLVSMGYCYRMFGNVNRTAADLVKLCLIWSGFLTLVNFYFVV